MFVRGETQGDGKEGDKVVNPDEINIDDDDEDEEDAEVEIPIEEQNVPSKVFGSLKKKNEDDDENE